MASGLGGRRAGDLGQITLPPEWESEERGAEACQEQSDRGRTERSEAASAVSLDGASTRNDDASTFRRQDLAAKPVAPPSALSTPSNTTRARAVGAGAPVIPRGGRQRVVLGDERVELGLGERRGAEAAQTRLRGGLGREDDNDKDTGLSNLPFRDFEHNRVWLQLVLIAHDCSP